MALSSGIALAGIGLACYFWVVNRKAAASVARSATPIYTLLLNKYYVDEIYNAVIVQPIKQMSTLVLWKGADAALIDGAVNGVGSGRPRAPACRCAASSPDRSAPTPARCFSEWS